MVQTDHTSPPFSINCAGHAAANWLHHIEYHGDCRTESNHD